jgi:hypothetical protein
MRSFVVAAVALLACACGDVLKATDVGVIDAYVPDSPVEPPMCGAGEMVCNGACANVMNSELYCGNCTTQCSPTQGCLNGACVPANTSCSRVKELDPTVVDGAFRNPNNSTVFYCDFTARKQYEFGIGQYNLGYFQYTILSFGSFDAVTQKAFVGVYNLLGGFQTISTFTSGLCCITQPDNLELFFGGTYLSLAQNGVNACNVAYNGIYQLMRGQSTVYTPPLPDDFFTTNPVSAAAQCGDTNNIGLFVKTSSF